MLYVLKRRMFSMKSSLQIRHLLHGDSVHGEGEKRVALSFTMSVTRVDEGTVACLGVRGPGCRNSPAGDVLVLIGQSALSVRHLFSHSGQ